jgi:hypothetical protein
LNFDIKAPVDPGPFFSSVWRSIMRIVPITPVPARPLLGPVGAGQPSPTAIICAALVLALVFLAFQIASDLQAPAFPDCSSIGDSVQDSCPLWSTRAAL